MFGTLLIRIAFASAILSSLLYFYSYFKKTSTMTSWARMFFHFGVVSIMFSSALMIYFIMTHHFEYNYIWGHSSTDLSPSLLFSTFYAGQEGSFTLWALLTGLLGIFLLQYSIKRNYEIELMSIYSLIYASLLLMIVVKNPFTFIWEVFPADLLKSGIPNVDNYIWVDQAKGIWAQIPTEGRGLNPLLQNYWMVIHPPILFLGFTALAVPFAHAVAALLKKDFTFWIKVAKPWVVFASLSLGTGIILGGYWAYETLGWGGFWGWDPVENSSFVPWLTSVALIHTMLTQSNSGSFLKTNFALSILSFILVLYSTFLTRSGVLGDTSVHSFVDPGMLVYWLLIGVMFMFMIIGFGLMIYRSKDMPKIEVKHTILSRDFALFLGAAVLVLLSFFVALGTSSPIITNIIKGKISAVDISYYNNTALPLTIILALLISFGQLLWWQSSKLDQFLKSLIVPSILSLIGTIFAIYIGVNEIFILVYIFSSLLALFVNIYTAYKISKETAKHVGGSVAHIGLALMLIGFITSSKYDDKKTLSLEQGKSYSTFGYNFIYEGYSQVSPNRYAFDIKIEDGKSIHKVAPIMVFNPQDNNLIRHPDIINLYTKDLYVSPVSLEEPKNLGTDLELLPNLKSTHENLSILYKSFTFEVVKGKGNLITVPLEISENGKKEIINLTMTMEKGNVSYSESNFGKYNLKIKTVSTGADSKSKPIIITVNSSDISNQVNKETLIAEISVKPFINLVWIGTVLLLLGFIITIIKRVKESNINY